MSNAEKLAGPSGKDGRSPPKSSTRQFGSGRSTRRLARVVLPALTLAAVGAGVYLWFPRFQSSPEVSAPDEGAAPEVVAASNEVVVPENIDELDPQVRAHLEEQIALVREAPDDASRHATLGIAYAANARWTEARDCFRMVLELDPGEVLAKYHVAVATQKLGDYTATRAMLQQIVVEHPDFAPAHHRLGVLLLEAGSVEAAESALEQAVALAPDLPHGYIRLAEVALQTQDHQRAVELLTQAIQIAPRNRMAHYLLGNAYRSLGRRADAERELKRGAGGTRRYMPTEWSTRVPDHAKGVPSQIRRAQRYSKNADYDKAVEVLETVLKWHPESVEALNDLATVYLRRGQPDKARELLLQALQLDETNPATYINLAASHADAGEPEQALRYVDRSIELAPTTAQAHATRARILMIERRIEEAAEAQETAVRLDPQNPAMRMGLANMFMRLRRFADAKENFEAVVTRFPSAVEAQLRLCGVCIRLGDEDRAATALEAARKLAPNHPQVGAMAQRLEVLRSRQ